MEKVVFELLSKEELSQISGGAVNFREPLKTPVEHLERQIYL